MASRAGDYIRHHTRHYDYTAYIAADGGPNTEDAASRWTEDSTWALATAWG